MLTKDEALALADEFSKRCPIMNKTAFDAIWQPLMVYVKNNLVEPAHREAFKVTAIRGL